MTSKQTVLVTGAAMRVGRAIALDFSSRGWQVAVHANRSQQQADAVMSEIVASGGKARVFLADLAEPSAIDTLTSEVMAEYGYLDCLINNASLFEYDDIESLTAESWSTHLAINFTAPVLLARSMYRHLPANSVGNIINIIDQRVWKPTPHFFSYSASKAGLWAVTRTLAQALAPRVRVNAIGPGPVLKSIHQSQADFDRQAAATLLGRATSPEEISAAIRYILDAPAMTGQMIALDGGQHLAWQTPDVGDGKG